MTDWSVRGLSGMELLALQAGLRKVSKQLNHRRRRGKPVVVAEVQGQQLTLEGGIP
jgi:hypothetical protein